MNGKQDWMTRWAPMLAVLGTLLVAGAAAVFYLGGELGRLDQGQTELKAGLARLETRVDALMDDVADIRERVSALEATS